MVVNYITNLRKDRKRKGFVHVNYTSSPKGIQNWNILNEEKRLLGCILLCGSNAAKREKIYT